MRSHPELAYSRPTSARATRRGGPRPSRRSEDLAAAVLALVGTAADDAGVAELAASLCATVAPEDLVAALDVAALRVARLVDFCMVPGSAPPAPIR